MDATMEVRPLRDDDRGWAAVLLAERWGGDTVVVHGTVYEPARLEGLVAELDGARAGLLTFHEDGADCEIVTLDAVHRKSGAGTAMIDAMAKMAPLRGWNRVWLVTTNDNLDAIRFYQRRAFRLVRVRPGAVDASRLLKPGIPETGEYGIPLRDELEFELRLGMSPGQS